MGCIEALNQSHNDNIQGIIQNVDIDYHPDYGIIAPDQYPVTTDGVTANDAVTKLIEQFEDAGYTIVDLSMNEYTFTGRALIEHSIDNQNFFVWHSYDQKPIMAIEAVVQMDGAYYQVKQGCTQCVVGVDYCDYWARIVAPIPTPPWTYSLYYHSTPELLLPYKIPVPSKMEIDDTEGTLQEIFDLNVAHREETADVINNVELDYHPVYGLIGPNDFPVSNEKMTINDAYSWIANKAKSMEIIEQDVEEMVFSGRALTEHLINGETVFVWHEYKEEPIIYARCVVRDPGDDSYNLNMRIWTKNGKNGAGYWSTVNKKIPCPTSNRTIDYSIEGARLIPCGDKPSNPLAGFSGSAVFINAGESITFNDLSTTDVTSWSWIFDGGTPSRSTLQNPTVTYNTPGTYSLSLTVKNASGSDTETKINYITVQDIMPIDKVPVSSTRSK
jgi:PKD repeat protein